MSRKQNCSIKKKMALKYIKTNEREENKLNYHSIYCYEDTENELS